MNSRDYPALSRLNGTCVGFDGQERTNASDFDLLTAHESHQPLTRLELSLTHLTMCPKTTIRLSNKDIIDRQMAINLGRSPSVLSVTSKTYHFNPIFSKASAQHAPGATGDHIHLIRRCVVVKIYCKHGDSVYRSSARRPGSPQPRLLAQLLLA